MAYEKVTRYNQIGKIDIQRAKFIDFKILQSEENDGWFVDGTSGEKYFKIQFTFADENDMFIVADFNYSKYVLYQDSDTGEDITSEKLCIKNLITCGVKDGNLANVPEAIGNFVRLGGNVELNDKGYQKIKLYINPVNTIVQKDVSEVDTKSLLAQFEQLNSGNAPEEQSNHEVKSENVKTDPVDDEDCPF